MPQDIKYKVGNQDAIITRYESTQKEIAIVIPAAYGDTIVSTCLPGIIKKHYPDYKVVFYISSIYADALKNNPEIDRIGITNVRNREEADRNALKMISQIQNNNRYFKVYPIYFQVVPSHTWKLKKNDQINFMYLGPSQLLRDGMEVTTPLETRLYQTTEEINKVLQFRKTIDTNRINIMMETEYKSSQSWWNPDWTATAVKHLKNKFDKFNLFISRGGPEPDDIKTLRTKTNNNNYRIYYLNFMSIREITVLFNYCDIMFSVSSGTANACMTHQCKRDILWFELARPTCDSRPMGMGPKKIIDNNGNMREYFRSVMTKINEYY